MSREFFVIASGQKTGGSIVAVIAALSPAQAHEFAANDFRKQNGLAANVHVKTNTLHRSTDEAEATLFFLRLNEVMDEHAAKADEDDV